MAQDIGCRQRLPMTCPLKWKMTDGDSTDQYSPWHHTECMLAGYYGYGGGMGVGGDWYSWGSPPTGISQSRPPHPSPQNI